MHGFGARTIVVVVAIAAATLLAACGGSTAPTATPAGGGGGTSAPGATSNGAGGGNVSSINACSLLTAAEIQAALGVPVKDGVEQDSDGQVSCTWDGQDEAGPSAGVTVATYDDTLWQTMSQGANAKPISGFGDAAYTGFPHQGDIAIKVKGFEVDLGIVDFTDAAAKIDAADKSLAQLVLSRLP
jgi:uncharacterized protein DUF3558